MSGKNFESPTQYTQVAGFVPVLGLPVLDMLKAKAGERILDIGAGEGKLTKQMKMIGCDVVGVDFSPEMVQSMKDDGINAAVMDAEDLTFVDQFDAVFSNAALHWCKDHDKVIAGVKKALVPGGRFVCEQGGFGNIKVIREALHAALQGRGITDLEARDPWNFSDVESMSRLLVKYGFTINSIELIPRPTRLPTDVKDWVDLFGNTFLVGFDAETRAAVLEEVQAACASLWDEDHGCYFADYVRLRYEAKLEH